MTDETGGNVPIASKETRDDTVRQKTPPAQPESTESEIHPTIIPSPHVTDVQVQSVCHVDVAGEAVPLTQVVRLDLFKDGQFDGEKTPRREGSEEPPRQFTSDVPFPGDEAGSFVRVEANGDRAHEVIEERAKNPPQNIPISVVSGDRRAVEEPKAPPARPEVAPAVRPEAAPPVRPEVTPPVRAEVAPPVRPEVAPPVRPEVAPPVRPEVAPPVRPEVAPAAPAQPPPSAPPAVPSVAPSKAAIPESKEKRVVEAKPQPAESGLNQFGGGLQLVVAGAAAVTLVALTVIGRRVFSR